MKDLGPLRYYLGIEVACLPNSYLLFQMKHFRDILQHVGLIDSRIVTTPLALNQKLFAFENTLLSDHPTRYQQVVGSHVYLTVTWPNIVFPIQVVSMSLLLLLY